MLQLGTTGIFVGLVFCKFIAVFKPTKCLLTLCLVEHAGLGTHQWNLRASELIKDTFLKPLYILVTVNPLVALFAKLSFYIYFFQIFSPKPILRWSIYIGAFVTVAFYVAITIVLFVLSTPPPGVSFAEQFVSYLTVGTSPALNATLALGYFNVLSDLYILILPISGVIRLNLQTYRKVGVILIFLTGLLALIASSVSLYFRYLVNNTGDSTWNLMPAAYLTILEYTIGVDCSCMPVCAVAVRKYLPLITTATSQLTSRIRILGARLSPRRSSRSRRTFSSDGSKSSADIQDIKFHADGGQVRLLEDLPEIPHKIHYMRTARAFFRGSQNPGATTMDNDSTYFALEKPRGGENV